MDQHLCKSYQVHTLLPRVHQHHHRTARLSSVAVATELDRTQPVFLVPSTRVGVNARLLLSLCSCLVYLATGRKLLRSETKSVWLLTVIPEPILDLHLLLG